MCKSSQNLIKCLKPWILSNSKIIKGDIANYSIEGDFTGDIPTNFSEKPHAKNIIITAEVFLNKATYYLGLDFKRLVIRSRSDKDAQAISKLIPIKDHLWFFIDKNILILINFGNEFVLTDTSLFIGKSVVDGIGLFTNKSIGSGSVIMRLYGVPYNLDKILSSNLRGEWNAPNNSDSIIYREKITPYYFINHSLDSNVKTSYVNNIIEVITVKNVEAGEEILSNYMQEKLPDSYFSLNRDWLPR